MREPSSCVVKVWRPHERPRTILENGTELSRACVVSVEGQLAALLEAPMEATEQASVVCGRVLRRRFGRRVSRHGRMAQAPRRDADGCDRAPRRAGRDSWHSSNTL